MSAPAVKDPGTVHDDEEDGYADDGWTHSKRVGDEIYSLFYKDSHSIWDAAMIN